MAKAATTRLLRLDLPIETWEQLDRMAAAEGKKIGLYCKVLLMLHAEQDQPEDEEVPEPSGTDQTPLRVPTNVEWAALVKWMTATDRSLPSGVSTKSGAMAWAMSQGFKP